MRELSVTYLILACGEEQVFELINFIKNHKDHEDKIMVLYDCTTSRPEFEKKLKQQSVKIVNHVLGLDYAAHRNAALEHIKTDYVFAIDADEVPHTDILEKGLLKKIIEQEDRPDIIVCPRLNLFEGVLPIHCLMYNWTLKQDICGMNNVVQWPDRQSRIFKNRTGVKWVGRLHEQLKPLPHHRIIYLPLELQYCLIHRKIMAKQIRDNDRYATHWSAADNSGETTQNQIKGN